MAQARFSRSSSFQYVVVMSRPQHKNARTTPATRKEIARSKESVAVLAERYQVSERTIRRWRHRTLFVDASHTPIRLQTTLTPAQEVLVVELRRTLFLSLDDLLTVCREFVCSELSRSALYRCMRRHDVAKLRMPKVTGPKSFTVKRPGCLLFGVKDLPRTADGLGASYLFFAMDGATRWVFAQIKTHKNRTALRAFLRALRNAYPVRFKGLRTENGKLFDDQLFAFSKHRIFDEREINRLYEVVNPPYYRTSGRKASELCDGRIADVLKTRNCSDGQSLHRTLEQFLHWYNHQFTMSGLHSNTPIKELQDWYARKPKLFRSTYVKHFHSDS